MNPVIIWAAVSGAIGLGVGFFSGKGASGIGDTVKYTVLGAAAFVAAKQLGVLK